MGTGAVSRRTQPESCRVREHHHEAGRNTTDDSRDFSHLWIHIPERLRGPGPWLEVTCINSCNPQAHRRPLWLSFHSNEILAHRGLRVVRCHTVWVRGHGNPAARSRSHEASSQPSPTARPGRKGAAYIKLARVPDSSTGSLSQPSGGR